MELDLLAVDDEVVEIWYRIIHIEVTRQNSVIGEEVNI